MDKIEQNNTLDINVTEFPLQDDIIYLNHAAVSPWPIRAVNAVTRFAQENTTQGSKNYPHWINTETQLRKQLQQLINGALRDSRWDITYLAMQIVIEGLALAAFATIRDISQNPLAQQVNAYVMQDEARHVMFGRLSLRDYYSQLSDAERDEREEFLVEACYHMRDRFQAVEMYERLGLPVEECIAYGEQSQTMQLFRSFLFQRIVPIVKDIGLWGPRIQKAYTDMGVIGYADVDIDALHDADDSIAKDFDARQGYVDSVIAVGKGEASAAE